MRIRSFIVAYALVLVILLFADRRPGSIQQDRYSHVVDLTDGQNATGQHAEGAGSRTRIIAPGALIPGTWAAGQIPPERLVAPLVVMDLNAARDGSPQISLDDISAWESHHGMIPQGAVVAIRRAGARDNLSTSDLPNTDLSNTALPTTDLPITDLSTTPLPIARDAAMFLIEARYTIAFAVETPVNLTFRPHPGPAARPPRELCGGRNRAPRLATCNRLAHHCRPGKKQRTWRSSCPHPGHGAIAFVGSRSSKLAARRCSYGNPAFHAR